MHTAQATEKKLAFVRVEKTCFLLLPFYDAAKISKSNSQQIRALKIKRFDKYGR